MTTGSLLLALALLTLVLLFVLRPFLLPPSLPPLPTEREQLLAQKEMLLAQIRALDFDAETGKLAAADHAADRERLLAQATAVLQQLDATQDTTLEAEIEAAVRQLRQQLRGSTTCPHCRAAVSPGDKFCANCGRPLEATAHD